MDFTEGKHLLIAFKKILLFKHYKTTEISRLISIDDRSNGRSSYVWRNEKEGYLLKALDKCNK